jgi:hypothetical protein
MDERDERDAPIGGRRGYTRPMTIIMLIAAAIIILVAIVQWVRV